MYTHSRMLLLAGAVIAWCAAAATDAAADPPSASIEVGVTDGGQVVWHDVEDNTFTAAKDGYLRVNANVSDWVYVLADAYVQPPPEPYPQSYIDLIAAWPFLLKSAPTTPDPVKYGTLPTLYVDNDLFESTVDAVFETGPLGSAQPTVRKLFQPVTGTAAGLAVRPIYGDSVTWIADGATERLDLWRNRAFRREITEDEETPNDIDHFSFEAFWQSALIEKNPAASDFFRDRDEYDMAMAYGLQLALQVVVLHAPSNDPLDYMPSNEELVPGLEDIDLDGIEIGLSPPIVFGVRVPGGSLDPDIAQNGPIVGQAGQPIAMWADGVPHKNSYVVVEITSGTYVCPLKFHDVHIAEFTVPLGATGTGMRKLIGNTSSVKYFPDGQYPIAISPYGG